MNRLATIPHYQVKRTTNGRVRFNLPAGTHQMLREMLEGWANTEPPERVGDVQDIQLHQLRHLAQELVVRRPLLMTLAENRFTVPASEAYGILALLWIQVMHGDYGGTMMNWLMNDLHQLLS